MQKLQFIAGETAKLPDHPVRVLGIDLGTTNSTVPEIIWDPNEPDQGGVFRGPALP